METGASKTLIYRIFLDEEVAGAASDLNLGLLLGSKEIRACLRVANSKVIAGVWKMPILHSALQELKQQLQEFSDRIGFVEVQFASSYWTLLPKGIFQESSAASYLQFNHTPPEKWTVASEPVLGLDAYNVYAYDPEWREMVLNLFPRSRFLHQNSQFLSTVLQWAGQREGEYVFLHLETGYAQVSIFKNKNLLLTNAFTCQTEEDVLFFVLYTINQLQLETKQLNVFLSGRPLSESSENLLKKYTHSVASVSEIADADPSVPAAVVSEYFDVANILLCE